MRIFLLFLFLFLQFFLSAQSSSNSNSKDSIRINRSGETHLFVIGVSNYKNLEEKHQLKYAHKDAELIKSYYKKNGVTDIEMLLDSAAINHGEINRKIRNKIINAETGDEVIIYFSGHGSYDEILKTGFLLLHNVEASSPALIDQAYGEVLKINELLEVAKFGAENQIKVKLIFDACKSGSIPAFTTPNLTCISACASNEKAKEMSQYQHGIFTYFLHKGLQEFQVDVNKDDIINFMELELFVTDKVLKATNELQHPQFISGNRYTVMGRPLLEEVPNEKGNNLEVRDRGFNPPLTLKGCEIIEHDFQTQLRAEKFIESDLDSIDKVPFDIWKAQKVGAFPGWDKKKPFQFLSSHNYHIMSNNNTIIFSLNKNRDNYRVLGAPMNIVTTIDFAPNGQHLGCGDSKGLIREWDLKTETILFEKKNTHGITGLCHLSNEQIFYTLDNGLAYICQFSSKKAKKLKGFKANIIGLKNFDGIVVAIDQKNGLWLINPDSGACNFLDTDNQKIIEIEYSSTFKMLFALTEQEKLLCIDFPSGKLTKSVNLTLDKPSYLTINNSQNYLYVSSSSKNKTIAFKIDDWMLNGGKGYTLPISGLMRYDEENGSNTFLMQNGELVSVYLNYKTVWPYTTENLYKSFLDCSSNKKLIAENQDLFLTSLNSKVEATLNALVNVDTTKYPSNNRIEYSIQLAKLATKFSDPSYINDKRLRINLHLLEVYYAIRLGDKSNYESAKKKLDDLLIVEPSNAYALNAGALLHLKFNELTLAKKMINEAEKSAGMWIEPTYNYGVILTEDGDLPGAEKKFEKVTKAAPKLEKGINAYIDVLSRQAKNKEADQFFRKVKKENPTMEIEVPTALKTYQNQTNNAFTYTAKPYNIDTLQLGDYVEGGKLACIDFEKKQLLIVAESDLDSMFWQDGKKACEELELNGYSDWRLPDYQELRAISSQKKALKMKQSGYWTSNLAKDPKQAVWVNFSYNDDISSDYFERTYGIRPVRIVQLKN